MDSKRIRDSGQSYKKIWMLEHRYIWERFNFACLLPWGVVHHKDNDHLNNNLSNLQGMTRKNHELTKVYHKTNSSNRRCNECKSSTTYIAKTKKGTTYFYWCRDPRDNTKWLCGSCKSKIYRRIS